MEWEFANLPYWIALSSDTHLKSLDVQTKKETILGEEAWDVSYRLDKLLGLPGINPEEEFGDIDNFFECLRPDFENNFTNEPSLVIFNYGAVKGIKFQTKEESGLYLEVEETNKKIKNLVEGSSVKKSFIGEINKILGKQGPHSSTTFHTEDIFGIDYAHDLRNSSQVKPPKNK